MEKDYYSLSKKDYDSQFDKVKLLGRYPWIGRKYSETDCRILILGDSHYATDLNGEFSQKEYDNFCKDKNSTRAVVNCVIKNVCEGDSTWKMFKNLIETFTSYTLNEVMDFWSKVAFYNFIQEPMKQINQVPSAKLRREGWECFSEVIDIIKPDFCLFIGIRSKNDIERIEELGGSYSIQNEESCCNGVKPFWGSIKTKRGTNVRFRIIKHCSRFYSPTEWYQYFCDNERELMLHLDSHFE